MTSPIVMPAAVLASMSESEFFASWWRRKFLHRPGGADHLLAMMPTMADVEALVDGPGHEQADVVRFLTFPTVGEPVTRTWLVGCRPPRQRDHDEAVNLSPADQWFPALAPLAAGLAAAFSAPANLQLFWAPPGGGVRPHRDLNDSFVIQVTGRKRWRVADPAASDGTRSRPVLTGNAGSALPANTTVIDMMPGDVLYKPSHGVHATESGNEPTLSLTCSVATRTAIDVLLEGLRARLAGDSVWHERFPLMQGSDDNQARALLHEALGRLAGRIPSVADLERLTRP